MAEQAVPMRFLVPLDGSDLATVSLPYLRALAGEQDDVVLLRMVPESTPLTSIAGMAPERVARVTEQRVDAAKTYLHHVSDVLLNETGHIRIRTEVGLPHVGIVAVAEEEDVDMIVMATHGRGFIGRAMVGSVADRVARTATKPVLLINPPDRGIPARAQQVANVRRLIVPLDGSERAREALPVVERLAKALGLRIHLLRAIDLRGEWVIDEAEDELDDLLTPMREDLTETMLAEAQRIKTNGTRASFQVTVGTPATVIAEAVEPGDVVVMTSHGASGIRRWLLGSVAEKLVRSEIAPVILVPVAGRETVAKPFAEA